LGTTDLEFELKAPLEIFFYFYYNKRVFSLQKTFTSFDFTERYCAKERGQLSSAHFSRTGRIKKHVTFLR